MWMSDLEVFLFPTLQLYARPDEEFSDHANVHKLLGHMVDSGVAAGYEAEEGEGGDREAGRRWGRPPKGPSINDVHLVHMTCSIPFMLISTG